MLCYVMLCLDKLLLQFGRVGPNEFSVDFSRPFNGLLAFGVAVSALTAKVILPSE